MTKAKVQIFVLGGTITMLPKAGGGIVPSLTGEELVAAVPELAECAELTVTTPFLVPGAAITLSQMRELEAAIRASFERGIDGVVVAQGTDTIDETAFLLDLAHGGAEPVVVTGAMRGASAPGADGHANLLSAVATAASPEARDLGVLVVLNDEIHAARFVEKTHKGLPSAFASPGLGPLGHVMEKRARIVLRPQRIPFIGAMPALPRIALVKTCLGDDAAMLDAVAGLGFEGAVIEAMGAGHLPGQLAEAAAGLASAMPVVLASRVAGGPIFRNTYAFPGSEIDLLAKGLVPAGLLSPTKARLLLAYLVGSGCGRDRIIRHFSLYE